MFLQRMNPMGTFNQFRRDMDRLFGDFLPDMNLSTQFGRGFPALNVWEDENQFFVEAEMPGLRLEDINVEVLGNEVSIQGTRSAESNNESATFHRRERALGEFSRRVALPAPIDSTRVQAALKDGVLTITLPKAEIAKARKIEVKASSEAPSTPGS